VILVLATAGVLVSAAIAAAGMHAFAQWPWSSAVTFGILIAATDPVSVIATFREAGVHGRLGLLMEAESLFNDGTAAVGFSVAIAVAAGQQMAGLNVLATALVSMGGGPAVWSTGRGRDSVAGAAYRGPSGGAELHHRCRVRLLSSAHISRCPACSRP
jgi:NhaP-type Na+/H+ or K+/H+ antiporter